MVEQVSANSFEDDRTGARFYRAKVKVDREHLKELAPHIELQPGMPAQVYIATVERTVLEYLITPFTQMLERASANPERSARDRFAELNKGGHVYLSRTSPNRRGPHVIPRVRQHETPGWSDLSAVR